MKSRFTIGVRVGACPWPTHRGLGCCGFVFRVLPGWHGTVYLVAWNAATDRCSRRWRSARAGWRVTPTIRRQARRDSNAVTGLANPLDVALGRGYDEGVSAQASTPRLAPRDWHPETGTPRLAPRDWHPETGTPRLAPLAETACPARGTSTTASDDLCPNTSWVSLAMQQSFSRRSGGNRVDNVPAGIDPMQKTETCLWRRGTPRPRDLP